jgi:hypothetical protein
MKGRANNAVTVTIAKNMVDVFVVLSFFISFLEPESINFHRAGFRII